MRIAVIAPSSPFPVPDFELGVARLRERYEVSYEPEIASRAGYLAGSDERRLGELLRALTDPKVDALLAARGGFGATRLLPELPIELIARNPKPLIGFSDVTALHALWARARQGSWHASMAAALGRASVERFARFIAAVEGGGRAPIRGLEALSAGTGPASGRLFGGNLTVLAALVGTPYAPLLDGSVLFLEDRGERPYRVDRMLTSLQQAGWLTRPKAIVLGAFTDDAPGPDGVTTREVLEKNLGALPIPVVCGVPAGHIDDNLELPLGALVEVDPQTGILRFLDAE